jgi:hypothetical protein
LKNKKGKGVLENKKLKSQMSIDGFDIDNSYFPFIPKILTKPFSIHPLSEDIADARRLRAQNLSIKNFSFEDRKKCDDNVLFPHPYKEEIVSFMNKFADKAEIFNEMFKTSSRESVECINFEKISIDENKNSSKELSEKFYFHDFFYDIENSNEKTNTKTLTHSEMEYPPLEKTKLNFIDTEKELFEMIDDINLNARKL